MNRKLPRLLRNFYVVTATLFLVWLAFFDSNDLINRFRLSSKIRALENEKAYYHQKIAEVKKDRAELTTNPELLEKFAREKYLMKKKTEDIFILEEK